MHQLTVGLGLAYYYIGSIGFLTYPLALWKIAWGRMGLLPMAVISSFLTIFCLKLVVHTPVELALVGRYYLGFLLFYCYFRSTGRRLDARRLLILIVCMNLIEAVLINTIIPMEWFPNAPAQLDTLHNSHRTAVFGFYQRPFGLGANPSVTSNLAVVLLSLIPNPSRKLVGLTVFSTMISMSGTGYLGLLVYFSLASPMIFVLAATVGGLLVQAGPTIAEALFKISPEYVGLLIQFKINQLMDLIPEPWTVLDILMGSSVSRVGFYGGDFQVFSFFLVMGVFMFLMVFLFVASRAHSGNIRALILLAVGIAHYGPMFTMPGQVIAGYCLAKEPARDPPEEEAET